MKTKSLIPFIAVLMIAGTALWADTPKSLMEDLGLPVFPGSSLITEGSLTAGQLLNDIVSVYGPILGLHDVDRVSNARYTLDQESSSRQVFNYYDPLIAKNGWKLSFQDSDQREITAVYFREDLGMLYLDVAPPNSADRDFTIMRVFGKVDPSKAVRPKEGQAGNLMPRPGMAGGNQQQSPNFLGQSRIPVGQAIALPPSQRLHMKFATSDVRARIVDRNTTEVDLQSKSDDPGELQRMDDRLILTVTPKIGIHEVVLPASVPLLLELTDGSLTLTTGPNPADRPMRLSIISTGAPITLQQFPLASGMHTIKSLGGEVDITFSIVQGGSLNVEVTGKILTVALPRDSSATLDASVSSGRIENFTGLQPEESAADHMKLRLGAGKADITLRAINGTVCIKLAD